MFLEGTSKKGRKRKGKKGRGKLKTKVGKDSLPDPCTSTSDDMCTSMGIVNVDLEYTEEDFETITTAKVNLLLYFCEEYFICQ